MGRPVHTLFCFTSFTNQIDIFLEASIFHKAGENSSLATVKEPGL